MILDLALAIAILGLLALVAARQEQVATRRFEGNAVVNDGDTLTIAGERFRLQGIDAPEFDQKCQADGGEYPCGRRARQALERLVAGKQVACSGWQRDKYGRLLVSCEANGVDLNRAQVDAGWAVAYGAYFAEERAAREGRRGLWAGTFQSPRDYRDVHGGMIEPEHGSGITVFFAWLRQIFDFSRR